MRLRENVTVTPRTAGLEVWDRDTGLKLELPVPDLGHLGADGWEELRGLGLVEEGLSRDEVRRRQEEVRYAVASHLRLARLNELLAFAVAEVPYFAARRDIYGVALASEDELARLPFMRKADVRANFPDQLVARGVDVAGRLEAGTLALSTTSGTTGERLQVVSDMTLPSYPKAAPWLWRLPPLAGPITTAVFTSPTCSATECHLGLRTYEERFRGPYTLFLNSTEDLFSLREDLVRNVAEELHRLQPTVLLCNPVYLHWLARRAQVLGVELPHIPAVLSSYQFLPELSRRAIERLLGTKVYDYYAASDLGGCRAGVECELGRVHVRDDLSLVETVTATGRCAPGQLGNIAVTTLATRVMPLVRYLVGDVGRLGGECRCSIDDWPVLEVHGRAKDLMRIGERWVTTRDVDQLMARAAGVDFYQVLQSAPHELTVSVVPAPGEAPAEAELKALLGDGLGVRDVRVRRVTRLDPEVSMKFRLSGSLVGPPPELLP